MATRKKKSRVPASTTGNRLVIVESPGKIKTIKKFLGSGWNVEASIGHIRELPKRAPKGSRQPVPGVEMPPAPVDAAHLNGYFTATYEISQNKRDVVTKLRKLAKEAGPDRIYFATDPDREGEAISWHLAEVLGINPAQAQRVTFDSITKDAVISAFETPRGINMGLVNAQQARRVLDRIVGYMVSPVLWKKVAGGMSAGRVQSVAARMVVDREREIMAFVPEERWSATACFTPDASRTSELATAWEKLGEQRDEKGRGPTKKLLSSWLSERGTFEAHLVEVSGQKFELGCSAVVMRNLLPEMTTIAEATGLIELKNSTTEDLSGKGPARFVRTLSGRIAPGVRYVVKSIETKRTTSKPAAPLITSSLQIAASSSLGFATGRTMGVAQKLYEGIEIPGEGLVGLISYMRTDSTSLSSEAINQARSYIKTNFGDAYLPDKPRFYGNKNALAQEAHEAIRPTDMRLHPDDIRESLSDEQYKLYRLIWSRTVASQMTDAQWDATAVLLERADKATGAIFRSSGRVLVFDGHLKSTGLITGEDETMPAMKEGGETAPFCIDPSQSFSSPPPRFNEASLVKKLEEEGIGRPSTYASIIDTIEARGYVEQPDRRFRATDLGMVVNDFLMQVFAKQFMDFGYTRDVEGDLDRVAQGQLDWREMLAEFHSKLVPAIGSAADTSNIKALQVPALYACPTCSKRTAYRFGKNGWFLSCMAYPQCTYAAPINSHGRPMLPEKVDLACPRDGSPLVLRKSRFGEFLACSLSGCDFKMSLDRKRGIKFPSPPPLKTDLDCSKCGSTLNLREGKRGLWLGCSMFPKCRGRLAWSKVPESAQADLESQLKALSAGHKTFEIRRSTDSSFVTEGTPVDSLLIPGGNLELPVHPDAQSDGSEFHFEHIRSGLDEALRIGLILAPLEPIKKKKSAKSTGKSKKKTAVKKKPLKK